VGDVRRPGRLGTVSKEKGSGAKIKLQLDAKTTPLLQERENHQEGGWGRPLQTEQKGGFWTGAKVKRTAAESGPLGVRGGSSEKRLGRVPDCQNKTRTTPQLFLEEGGQGTSVRRARWNVVARLAGSKKPDEKIKSKEG